MNAWGKGIAIAAIWGAVTYMVHSSPDQAKELVGYAVGGTALVAFLF